MFRLMSLALCSVLTTGVLALAEDAPNTKVSPQVKMSQRASEIIGLKVKNAAGKDLGTINDIVLDAAQSNIRYYAVSYGGWLGLGDKLFAVPPKSFEWRQDDNHHNYLGLNQLGEPRNRSADKRPDSQVLPRLSLKKRLRFRSVPERKPFASFCRRWLPE
jgi:sporulation protein YlmC with PRC-barrel domain